MFRIGKATRVVAASGIAAVVAGLIIVIFWAESPEPPPDVSTIDGVGDEHVVKGHTPGARTLAPDDFSGSGAGSSRDLSGSERIGNGAVESIEFGDMDARAWIYADDEDRKEARQLKYRQREVTGETGGPPVLDPSTTRATGGPAPVARSTGPQGSGGMRLPPDLPGPGLDLNPSTGLPKPPSEEMQTMPGPEFGSDDVPSSGPTRPLEEVER